MPLQEIQYSLTWNLLKGGQPIMGSIDELAQLLQGRLVPIGPNCEHWLGVPLLRDGRVVGGIVMQSYRDDTRYTQNDRELLTYVAQHVQTALERRAAHAELERRVTDRTAALREANRVLRQQVLQRQRGERLQAALFRIAEMASAPESLEGFYAAVHRIISGLLYARNFYIALLDEDNHQLTFPYSVDEVDAVRPPRSHGRGATEYVLRHGKPLLADPAEIDRLVAIGEISQFGARSVCWLGVPLVWNERVMGVLALQSYTPEHTYSARDQELLTFVSYHIANALQRKHTTESLKQAYASLERRVDERTRALALANRDLREQIAERERVERRLKYETLHDSLTGLPNRTLLLQRLDHALDQYKADPQKLFAVLFIDLDRFKVINDSVGHLVGDDLLFQVGGRIRACLKTRDLVARLGGDEFAVLLDGITDADDAAADRRTHHQRAAGAVPARHQGDLHLRLDRHRAARAALPATGRAAARCRRGDVQRQGRRPPSRRAVRRSPAPRSAVAAGNGRRPAPRAVAQRVRPVLPAGGSHRRRPHRRLRGAAALEPSGTRTAARRATS